MGEMRFCEPCAYRILFSGERKCTLKAINDLEAITLSNVLSRSGPCGQEMSTTTLPGHAMLDFALSTPKGQTCRLKAFNGDSEGNS